MANSPPDGPNRGPDRRYRQAQQRQPTIECRSCLLQVTPAATVARTLWPAPLAVNDALWLPRADAVPPKSYDSFALLRRPMCLFTPAAGALIEEAVMNDTSKLAKAELTQSSGSQDSTSYSTGRSSNMRITLDLTETQAAALKRFAEKTGYAEAMAVLYPHVDREIRGNQAHEILIALARIDEALADLHVHSWPWIETGELR